MYIYGMFLMQYIEWCLPQQEVQSQSSGGVLSQACIECWGGSWGPNFKPSGCHGPEGGCNEIHDGSPSDVWTQSDTWAGHAILKEAREWTTKRRCVQQDSVAFLGLSSISLDILKVMQDLEETSNHSVDILKHFVVSKEYKISVSVHLFKFYYTACPFTIARALSDHSRSWSILLQTSSQLTAEAPQASTKVLLYMHNVVIVA